MNSLSYTNLVIVYIFICSAGFLTMTVDDTNSYLVTGDADGVIKVWDMSEYCLGSMADNDTPPRKYYVILCNIMQYYVIYIFKYIIELNTVKLKNKWRKNSRTERNGRGHRPSPISQFGEQEFARVDEN